jgi:dephospho-CoA kinase
MGVIVAVVGLPGCGKSEVVKLFEKHSYYRVYFGDVTFEEMSRLGLEINEKNERAVRERLRKEYGMDIYAKRSVSKIEEGLKKNGKVVIESMYSFEEYKFLKSKFRSNFNVLAVMASPNVRYARLEKRPFRPLSRKECEDRDFAQIENLHQGGPIAMADFVVINEGTLDELRDNVEKIITDIEGQARQ